MIWWFLWTSMCASGNFFTYSLNVFLYGLFYLAFFFFCPLIWDLGRRSRPLFALLPSPAPLGEHQGVPELYGSYKTYLVVSSWLKMFITTHCYIFVLVGFFRCLRDPGSYVVMEIQENFTKQPPKEDISAVTPGLSPRKGPVEEHLVTMPEYIFYSSLRQIYLFKKLYPRYLAS